MLNYKEHIVTIHTVFNINYPNKLNSINIELTFWKDYRLPKFTNVEEFYLNMYNKLNSFWFSFDIDEYLEYCNLNNDNILNRNIELEKLLSDDGFDEYLNTLNNEDRRKFFTNMNYYYSHIKWFLTQKYLNSNLTGCTTLNSIGYTIEYEYDNGRKRKLHHPYNPSIYEKFTGTLSFKEKNIYYLHDKQVNIDEFLKNPYRLVEMRYIKLKKLKDV